MKPDLFSYSKELELLKALGWVTSNVEDKSNVLAEQLCVDNDSKKEEPYVCTTIKHAPAPMVQSLAREVLKQFQVQTIYACDSLVLEEAVSKLLAGKTTLAVDIETYAAPKVTTMELNKTQQKKCGLDPNLSEIRTVQFYDGGPTAYVFDVKALGGLEALQPLFNKALVAHNAAFELKHLLHKGVTPYRVGCTMLQANILLGDLWSLKDLSKELLGIDISKEQQTSDWSAEILTQEQIEYAALDAVLTKKIFEIQHQKLEGKNLLRPYALMRDAQIAIAKLELTGVFFDVEGHKQMIAHWESEKQRLALELKEVLGEINPASSMQLGVWLNEKLDKDTLDKWPKTPKGKLKTDATALGLFHSLPLVKPLLDYKDNSKNLNTYGTSYAAHISPVTNRIHASFRIGGTATGRLSCNKPNIQNPPRDKAYRALFCAPEGRKLVVADFSQIELRVAALVANDPTMLAAYENGEDLHKKTAAAVLGVKQEEVTKEQRQMAKAVNFGLLYGQGAKGLARYAKSSYGVDMSEEEAEKARKAFFKTYRGLREWQRQTGRLAEITQRVETMGGRVRDFSKEEKGYKYTEALNTPIQGAAAEIMLAALIRVEYALRDKDASLVNVVHDEIVVETEASIADDIKKIVETCMSEAFLDIFFGAEKYMKDLVEAHIGSNWAEAK